MKTPFVLIIAEVINHNGDIETAKKLIDAASKAKADFIKFQTFKADKLVTKEAQKASYQQQTTKNNETQFEMLKRLELDENEHFELKIINSKKQ